MRLPRSPALLAAGAFALGLAAATALPAASADTARAAPPAPGAAQPPNALLTVFLRHDQTRPLAELNEQLFRNGYYDRFPPDGIEVVSWYVVMGIGQVVTLRVPPERLREVNVALEQTAWGAYATEFYPTYDYRQLAEQQRQSMRARRK